MGSIPGDMGLSKLQELVMDREACSPWGHKELDMTERLDRTELNDLLIIYLTFTIILFENNCYKMVSIKVPFASFK